MEDELVEEIVKLKTDMVLSSTKYSISGKTDQNDKTVLDSVVLSWLDTVQNAQDLKEKYETFKQLDFFIKRSFLFDYVQSAASDKNSDAIVHYAIQLYQRLIQDEEYQALSPRCGYQLSNEFGIEKCYYDGTLQKKLLFYYAFRDKISSIYNELLRKGVFKR